MTASYAAELLKLRKRPAIWVLGGLALVLTLAFGYLIPYVSYATGNATSLEDGLPAARVLAQTLPGSLVSTTISGFPVFLGAIALIVGGLVSGSEYGWGTIKTTLTQRPGRLSVLGGKLAALASIVALLTLAIYLVAAVTSVVIAAVESASLTDWPGAATLLKGLAGGWLVLFMWSLFGLLIGFVARGPAMAVGLGLVWALVIENLVRGVAPLLGVLEALQKALPGANAGSLAAALGATAEGGGTTPGVVTAVSGAQATGVLIAFVIVFATIAASLLHRRDVA